MDTDKGNMEDIRVGNKPSVRSDLSVFDSGNMLIRKAGLVSFLSWGLGGRHGVLIGFT